MGESYVLKVADFGLARDIYKDEHYVKTTAVRNFTISVFEISNCSFVCKMLMTSSVFIVVQISFLSLLRFMAIRKRGHLSKILKILSPVFPDRFVSFQRHFRVS